tara:strand:- start:2895 stop:3797 length:903 start_codon:yes stop_codon:yes gene_type:complete
MKVANLRAFPYVLKSAFWSIWSNLEGTIYAVLTTAVMLLMFGGFLVVNDTLERMIDAMGRRTNMVVYLNDNALPSDTADLVGELENDVSVGEVVFISRDDAAVKFRNTLDELAEILDVIENNPFPASIEIRMNDPEAILVLADELRSRTNIVEEVLIRDDVVSRLLYISQLVRFAGGVLIVSIGLVTIFVIQNTIRLAVFSRRDEIEIMKLIGATDWFVRGPFVVEGAIIGLLGSAIASAVLIIGFARVGPRIESVISFLPIQTGAAFVSNVSVFTIVVGVLLGAAGSYLSVHRHLASIE